MFIAVKCECTCSEIFLGLSSYIWFMVIAVKCQYTCSANFWAYLLTFCSCSLLFSVNIHALKIFFGLSAYILFMFIAVQCQYTWSENFLGAYLLTFSSFSLLFTVNITGLKFFGAICLYFVHVHCCSVWIYMLWNLFLGLSVYILFIFIAVNCQYTLSKKFWAYLLTFCSCSLLFSVNINALKFFWGNLLTFCSCS